MTKSRLRRQTIGLFRASQGGCRDGAECLNCQRLREMGLWPLWSAVNWKKCRQIRYKVNVYEWYNEMIYDNRKTHDLVSCNVFGTLFGPCFQPLLCDESKRPTFSGWKRPKVTSVSGRKLLRPKKMRGSAVSAVVDGWELWKRRAHADATRVVSGCSFRLSSQWVILRWNGWCGGLLFGHRNDVHTAGQAGLKGSEEELCVCVCFFWAEISPHQESLGWIL